MSEKTLNIRTFAEAMRERMDKKSCIKDFDIGTETIQIIDLTRVFHFYYQLLKAVVYSVDEDGIPDISKTMTTQLKRGNDEVHQKIKEIAQRKETRRAVAAYFEVNLIPNIPSVVRASVLDDVDALVQNDKGIAQRRRKSLKELRNSSKDGASYLADVWLLAICNGKNVIDEGQKYNMSISLRHGTATDVEFSTERAGEVLDRVDALLFKLPRPKIIEPAPRIQEHELAYVAALYKAYGEAVGVEDFNESTLATYPQYDEDFFEQRVDYFAAYTVSRGVLEFNTDTMASQFDILKMEIYDGVAMTARKDFLNGYARLLAVLEQAVSASVTQYILNRSPYWISNKIKKGTCHFLVSEGRLKWVRK